MKNNDLTSNLHDLQCNIGTYNSTYKLLISLQLQRQSKVGCLRPGYVGEITNPTYSHNRESITNTAGHPRLAATNASFHMACKTDSLKCPPRSHYSTNLCSWRLEVHQNIGRRKTQGISVEYVEEACCPFRVD